MGDAFSVLFILSWLQRMARMDMDWIETWKLWAHFITESVDSPKKAIPSCHNLFRRRQWNLHFFLTILNLLKNIIHADICKTGITLKLLCYWSGPWQKAHQPRSLSFCIVVVIVVLFHLLKQKLQKNIGKLVLASFAFFHLILKIVKLLK